MRERAAARSPSSIAGGWPHQQVKWCADCKQIKPLSDFCKNKRTRDGHAQYCRTVTTRERGSLDSGSTVGSSTT